MATLGPAQLRGRAGGWYMVGNMSGGTFSAGIAMWCAERFGTTAAAFALARFAAGPCLAALTIAEPESPRVGLLPAMRRVHADILGAFQSRREDRVMLHLRWHMQSRSGS